MPLTPGTRLGPYEIVSPLGAGGMGEVYRARDTNLDRDVALKILPDLFAEDAERLERFQREAKALAALNHPNIAQIYRFERFDTLRPGETPGVGPPSGSEAVRPPRQALVLEYIEGEDLSERIARGALPVDDALPIARQIIDALEAAHEAGIVHRDLKPANVKVREDGTVKVLDFGLAKALGPDPAGAAQDAANSPTLTARATQMGMILGTAAYMSPEQARGRAVDKRTDVWAFGCVLYEMLTGRKAFDGEDVTEMISAVMKTEPDWSALPADVPAAVRTVVTRCLVKDRKARIPDLSVVRYLLDGMVAADPGTDDPAPMPQRSVRLWQAVSATLVVTTLVAGAAWYDARTAGQAEPADIIQFTLAPPGEGGLSLSRSRTGHIAISPDGRLVVYQGRRGDEPVLVIRRLEETEGVVLRGSEGGVEPFFSPGSDFVGFVDADLRILKRVSVNGGTAKEIFQLDGSLTRIGGATWTDDGQVIVGVEGGTVARALGGLFSVSADGGSPVKFSNLDTDMNLSRPSAIPGTRAVLFVSSPGAPGLTGQLMVLDRDTGVATSLDIPGTNPIYLPSGHLLYATWDGEVMAAPFDIDRLGVTGAPVSVLAFVQRNASGAADFSVSRQGRLVYIAGAPVSTAGELVWVAPDGTEEPIAAPVREYQSVRISPDGKQLLVDIADASPAQRDSDSSLSRIWLWDLTRPSLLRPWTIDATPSERPVWSADGTRVVYSDGPNLYARMADGTGDAEPLTHATEGRRSPNAISPDGGVLFSYSLSAGTRQDVRMVSLDGDQAVTPLVQTDASEYGATLSPDGRWMAFVMGLESAKAVYARPFRDAGGAPIPISAGGGWAPVWSHDGRHVYYVEPGTQGNLGQLMEVPVETGDTLVPGVPRTLFDVRAYNVQRNGQRFYDVAPDGRFVMIKPVGSQLPSNERPAPPISVVLNFFEQLKSIR